MSDAIGLADAMLGLDGFRVLAVCETAVEVIIRIETTRQLVGCPGCGVQATAHERMVVECRDLPAFGRPARLVWAKRRWRCEEALCDAKTWSESSPAFSARCLLTNRAGVEACRQVGRNARPVAQLADELGVCWQTVMGAVREHGQPLIDDPDRVGVVRKLGVDETAWLAATREHSTVYATGIVDLDERIVIDVVPGNTSNDLGSWLDEQPSPWLAGVGVVATDLAESYRSALAGRLDHALASPTPSTSYGPATVAWTRCADACRTTHGRHPRTKARCGQACVRLRTLPPW